MLPGNQIRSSVGLASISAFMVAKIFLFLFSLIN